MVQREQERLRAEIERDPTSFFQDIYPGAIRDAATAAAKQFGGEAADWVFCENATVAVSSVLSSLPLSAGDEIVTTSHCYGAVRKAMQLWAERKGASLRIADVPVPVRSGEDIVQAIAGALTQRTRLLIVDHITSPTAIVFPAKEIVRTAHAAKVPVLVDGAHAPGQIALDVPDIGADWYTGNAHKWFFAPRGCGLLWTARQWQEITRPAVLSHGIDQGYSAAFDWVGTRDVTPWLSLAAAAGAYEAFGGSALRERNRRLAADAGDILMAAIGGTPSAPPELRAAMVSLCFSCDLAVEKAALIRTALRDQGVIIAVAGFGPTLCLRFSAQIYNQDSDYRRCAEALRQLGFPELFASAA
ncbi:MAG TPA: aminotransferase class V-fold PLP-dependent enzyme [Rhizomicrobium sp.]